MIQIQLKPEIEAQIAAEAQARGLAIDRYIEELVETRPAVDKVTDSDRRQAVEDMLAFTREYGLTLGGASIEDLIHEGHPY
jgi:hypothetical protein